MNRRTSVLFCKPKSVSPPKSAENTETQPTSPQLGTKTFLSVVLPRLETLLQPRKRSRSTCGDSEVEEGSPGKRLDTGKQRPPCAPSLGQSGWGWGLQGWCLPFAVHGRRQTRFLSEKRPVAGLRWQHLRVAEGPSPLGLGALLVASWESGPRGSDCGGCVGAGRRAPLLKPAGPVDTACRPPALLLSCVAWLVHVH